MCDSPAEPRHILVALRDDWYFDRVMAGIMQYADQTPGWSLWRFWGYFEHALPTIRRNRPQGVILGTVRPRWIDWLENRGIPGIAIGHVDGERGARVAIDETAIGRVAVQHLADRGLHRLLYVGHVNDRGSEVRGENFVSAARAAGCEVATCELDLTNHLSYWDEPDDLVSLLRQMRMPIGLLAYHDRLAVPVGQICRNAGYRIPEDVALLGVDNHRTLCEMARPTLSTIETADERVGYEAARLLDQLVDGLSPRSTRIAVEPQGVVSRESTRLLPDDEVVARALLFIRRHARERLSIDQIAQAAGVSRRTLQLRMKHTLGRTPRQELLRHRLTMAQQMLRSTERAMDDVAEQCGFGYAQRMASFFRRHLGTSPGEYRQSSNGDGAATGAPRGEHHRSREPVPDA